MQRKVKWFNESVISQFRQHGIYPDICPAENSSDKFGGYSFPGLTKKGKGNCKWVH